MVGAVCCQILLFVLLPEPGTESESAGRVVVDRIWLRGCMRGGVDTTGIYYLCELFGRLHG